MGPATPIRLNDREMPFRMELGNARMATMILQNLSPPQAPKLDLGGAALQVLRGDPDAIIIFLWQGCLPDRQGLTQKQVERWYGKEIAPEKHGGNGRDPWEFIKLILDGLNATGAVKVNYRVTSAGADDAEDDGAGAPRPSLHAVEPASRD